MTRRLSGQAYVAARTGRFAGRARTSLHMAYAATARSAQRNRTSGDVCDRHAWAVVIAEPIEARVLGERRAVASADIHTLPARR